MGEGAHSYLGDGRVVCWVVPTTSAADPEDGGPPGGWALDAEVATAPVPRHIGARWQASTGDDPELFWRAWCATEVLAKLAEVPVVLLVRAGPFLVTPVTRPPFEVHWLARPVRDVMVVHGMAWAGPDTSLI